MKKIVIFGILVLLILLFAVAYYKSKTFTTRISDCCNSTGDTCMNFDDEQYYKIDDFESIIMGVSTFTDVYDIAPTVTTMQVTSYGGICKYPTSTGGEIVIKFCGKDLVVWSIVEYDYREE